MDFKIRAMTEAERKYSYTQSRQIASHAGCIGHLRAYMDNVGPGFFSSWEDHRGDLKSDAFKADFDGVINALRFSEKYDEIFDSLPALEKFCYSNPESSFGNDREFGFRADTEKFSYMFRLNPNKGEYNIYCYCYRRDWLDYHLACASRGIRFIDTHYNELFKIPDGGKIREIFPDGKARELPCRYIDDYHVEIGSEPRNLYHIMEFAKLVEYHGSQIEPAEAFQEQGKPLNYGERDDSR